MLRVKEGTIYILKLLLLLWAEPGARQIRIQRWVSNGYYLFFAELSDPFKPWGLGERMQTLSEVVEIWGSSGYRENWEKPLSC